MKLQITLIFFLLISSEFIAQNIVFHGVVYEHNSKTKTGQLKLISDVQVIIPKSVPVTSDVKGKFKTFSDGLNIGESVSVKLIKNGYQVVNYKELETVFVGRKDDLIVYMASQSELQKAQLEYYNLAKKSIESAHLKKIQLLSLELKNLKIENDEYTRKIEILELESKAAIQNAQNLSKQLSEINLDFAGNLLKKAVLFYQKGEIDSCLSILHSDAYKEAGNKVVNDVESLRKGMSQAGSGIKTLIDREFLLAKIYSTTLLLDSIESSTGRIVKLCIQNADILGCGYILNTIKTVIKYDPSGKFKWKNEDFFEDLIGLIRLKSGRNSLDEAEAIRLFGYDLMLKNQAEEAGKSFLKSLEIHKKIGNADTALVLINLIELEERSLTYFDGFNSFTNLFTNKEFKYNGYQNNDYWIRDLFNNVEDMQYAYSVLINRELGTNNLLKVDGLCRSFMRVYAESEIQNTFDSDMLSNIKALNIFTKSRGSTQISNDDLRSIILILKECSPFSIEYLKLSSQFSEFLVDTEFLIYLDKNLKDSLLISCSDILINLSNEYYSKINDNEIIFKLKFCKTTISLFRYLSNFPEENDLQFLAESSNSLAADWLNLSSNNYAHYAFYLENILFKTHGCDYRLSTENKESTSLRDGLKDLSKIMASKNLHRGLELYKNFILHSSDCEISEETVFELLKLYDGEAFKYSMLKDRNRYMIITSNPLDEKCSEKFPVGFNYLNCISDFYFGSEYALKVGKHGVVRKADNWNTTNYMESTTDYQSLWKLNMQYARKSDIISYNNTIDEINKNSFAIFLQNSKKIDTIKFFGDTITYGPLLKSPPSDAFCLFATMGNSVLFDLDEIYNKLAWHYDEYSLNYGGYSKNLELLNKFQNFGLSNFFLGYSKVEGNPISAFGNILFFGLKSAMILNKSEDIEKIENSILDLYDKLSEANKVRFLNDFIFLSFYKNQIQDIKKPNYVNFNNKLFNQFYNNLSYLLKNETNWSLKLNSEDKRWVWERDQIILESYLTLSGASYLSNFNPEIFEDLKIKFPNESRLYRNEALYYFNKDESKLALDSLKKAISLGFVDKHFFLNNYSIKKYHSKIKTLFK